MKLKIANCETCWNQGRDCSRYSSGPEPAHNLPEEKSQESVFCCSGYIFLKNPSMKKALLQALSK